MSRVSGWITLAILGLAGTASTACAASPQADGGTEGMAQLPETPTGRRVAALVTALNTGDPSAIETFVERSYRPDVGGAPKAKYWTAVQRELGPLSFRAAEEDAMSHAGHVFWYRGTVTGAWVGLDLELEADNPYRIVANGVRRGIRPSVVPDGPAVPRAELPDSIEAFLTASAGADHFSGVVIVAQGDDVVFEGAFGMADRQDGVPNTLDTPFRLASATKMFTGVAIAQLVERGKLSFDDLISRIIPEYPEHIGRQVTVRHLLTHTSGIELDDDPEFNAAITRARSVEELLEVQLRYIERLNSGNYQNFAPLESFDYTNEGIDLLGVVIERASGQTWSDYVRSNVLGPAGMKRTGTDFLTPIPDLAKSYSLRGTEPGQWVPERRLVAQGERGAAWIRPAGTGYATAPDMLRFFRALSEGKLLGPDLANTITSPQIQLRVPSGLEFKRSYGFGFRIEDTRKSVRVVGHTGGGPGMSTVVQIYPELDITVIVLANYDRAASWVNQHIQELLGIL
ncbi:MAG: serine hydrolase domain-containing protein [Gemmatimonadota bacterium]